MRGERKRRLIAWQLLGLGWYVAVCVAGGVAAGVYLDGRLDAKPLFTLLGVLVGTIAAFYGLYKMVKPLLDIGNEKTAPRNGGPDGDTAP